jgi:hypothetical protein
MCRTHFYPDLRLDYKVATQKLNNFLTYPCARDFQRSYADCMPPKSLKSCSKRLFPSIERPVAGKSLPIYARQSSHPLAIELEENDVLVWNPTAALRAIDSLLIAALQGKQQEIACSPDEDDDPQRRNSRRRRPGGLVRA